MNLGDLAHAFLDTAGPGGIVVISVLLIGLFIYIRLTRWIIKGGK